MNHNEDTLAEMRGAIRLFGIIFTVCIIATIGAWYASWLPAAPMTCAPESWLGTYLGFNCVGE